MDTRPAAPGQRLPSLLILLAFVAVTLIALHLRPTDSFAAVHGTLAVSEAGDGLWTDDTGTPIDPASHPLAPGQPLRYRKQVTVELTGDISARVEVVPAVLEGDPDLVEAIEADAAATGARGAVPAGGEVITGAGRYVYDVEVRLEMSAGATSDLAGKPYRVTGAGLIATQVVD